MTIQEAFENFILSRRLADLSPKSIYDYTCFIAPFVDSVGRNKPINEVQQTDINRYIEKLLNRQISKNTLATYIRNVKVFLKWCSENFEVQYTYSKIKVPKTYKKKVKLYIDQELFEIFERIHTESEWLTLRNKCIVALMLDSGLRQSEVCTLERKNVSYSNMTLVVCGKGCKERTVPLGSLACRFLREYLEKCPYKSKYVFCGRRGNRLTTDAVKKFMHKLANELPYELSSHKLRHNFATNYCLDQYEERGQMDVYKLMVLMGHENLSTTRRYMHQANEVIASKNNISHLDKVFSGVN